MNAWRLILVPFLNTLVLSVPSHSKGKFPWAINPEVHESKKLYRDAERTGRDIKTIKALGRRTSAFAKSLMDKKHIKLEFDSNNASRDHREKYGRILGHVYLMDRSFLNVEIITWGYGFVYTRSPFKYMEEFRQYARENKRGLLTKIYETYG